MAVNLDAINVLAELEHFKIEFEYGSGNELKTLCPFHSDENPSCFINTEKREFCCKAAGCERSGDLITFLAVKTKKSRAQIIVELSQRYSLENEDENQIIDFRTVEQFHLAEIPRQLLNELYKRGITDEDISYYRIGFDFSTKRITVPIRNSEGLFVNIRKYLPGAPGPEKFKNSKGHGKIRLFPIDQLKYSTIMICGGELKAIAAARFLNRHNIGAISATCGESNWSKDLTDNFIGKHVIICFDVDDSGENAAKIRARILHRVAASTRILTLPLDKQKYPKGDINDFIGQENRQDLFELLSNDEVCQTYVPLFTKQLDNSETATKLHLSEAIAAKNVGTRVAIDSVLSSIDTAPFVVPKNVFATCDRSQKVCSICNIFRCKENELYELNSESSSLLEMVHSRKNAHREALMESLGIPKKCPVVEFHPNNFNNYEDTRLSPQLEITDRATDRFLHPSLILANENIKLELNESYELTGRNWPHPQTQQSTLILSDYKQTVDALSNYKLSDEYKEKLKCFMPNTWDQDGLKEKLDSVYSDLASNVTRIFSRQPLHLAIDLCYHSPLFINFDGEQTKGWLEILILGDSAQGKSVVSTKLKAFYGLGEKVESKNATVAGLLGGLQKTGDRWFVTWGLFPNQDKRLLILEELKGMSQETFAKLTDMRSSGLAEIPKIEKRRTHSRTRLIALSNTRSGRELRGYTYGVKAIEELIGSIEDVRRFDFALICSNEDVPQELINIPSFERENIDHKYTSDLCRNLILWSWTANCSFERDAEKQIYLSAGELPNKFHDSIPLVDKGSMRHKLARLAAALAARTFSHDEECNILVRKCHVDYIIQFLTESYSAKSFGYDKYTETLIDSQKLQDENKIIHEFNNIENPKEFCRKLLYANSVDAIDIADFYGSDRETANNLLGLLVRKNAVYRAMGRYYKYPQFIDKLRYWQSNGVLKGKPEYLRKKEEKF